jgi:hypothetical protein
LIVLFGSTAVRPRENGRGLDHGRILLDLTVRRPWLTAAGRDPHRAVDDDGAGARIDDHLRGRLPGEHVDILDPAHHGGASLGALREPGSPTAPPLIARAIG